MPRPGVAHDAFIQPLPDDIQVSPGDSLPPKRSKCLQCGRSSLWFCPQCMIAMLSEEEENKEVKSSTEDSSTCQRDEQKQEPSLPRPQWLPQVDLPIPVDIIHHPTEKLTKSTAPHAAVLAPKCQVIDLPHVPEYDKPRTLLLFPSEEAISIDAVKLEDYERVVFVDCTWSQAPGILAHPNLQGLQHVKLEQQHTAFWRTQRKGPDHLATVEAVYYFFRQHHTAIQGSYNHEYDDLLFFYVHQHKRFISTQTDQVKEYMQSEECKEKSAEMDKKMKQFSSKQYKRPLRKPGSSSRILSRKRIRQQD